MQEFAFKRLRIVKHLFYVLSESHVDRNRSKRYGNVTLWHFTVDTEMSLQDSSH